MVNMMTEQEVWDKLRLVIDPELKVNIVDLGLVYKVEAGKKIHILMTLTSPGCPLAGMFDVLIKHQLKADADIELTFDPPWTSDMMSEAAKIELGM